MCSGREPSLPRYVASGENVAHLGGRVGIGMDRERDAAFERAAQQAPVEVEPVRIAVDLDHHPGAGRGVEDAVEIDLVSGSRQQEAPRRMSQERDEGAGQGAHDPVGHLLDAHAETRVDGRDDEIEPREHLVAVIDRAVRENVRLGSLENAHRLERFPMAFDLRLLLDEPCEVEAASVVRRLRMIGDAHVLEPALARVREHLAHRRAAVRVRRVDVKDAADLLARNEAARRFRAVDELVALPQLRLDVGCADRAEKVPLARERPALPSRAETVLLEREALRRRALDERLDELLRPGLEEEHGRQLARRTETDPHRNAARSRPLDEGPFGTDVVQHRERERRFGRRLGIVAGRAQGDLRDRLQPATHAPGHLDRFDPFDLLQRLADQIRELDPVRQKKARSGRGERLHRFQHLLLRPRSEAANLRESALAAGPLEILHARDPELVQDRHLRGAEPRNAREREEAFRVLPAQRLEVAGPTRVGQVPDHAPRRFSDPGGPVDLTRRDEGVDRHLEPLDDARGVRVRSRLETIPFPDLEIAGDLVEGPRDLFSIVHPAALCKNSAPPCGRLPL